MARLLFALLLAIPAFGKDCIPFDQAIEHIGKTACVAGKVLKVGQGRATLFLDFCEDYKKCPFVVVVFRSNLRKLGDVRQLEGKEIQITGKIVEWNDRAEIILKDLGQLEGISGKLPPIPKTYDASNHGSFSAGSYSSPKSKHPTHKRNSQQPADDLDAE